MTDSLSHRALNRALLERQHLLQRVPRPAADVIEHLIGLQAQNPLDPYYALWARVEGFDADELVRLLANREAVRCWPMRKTVHLLTARDARVLLSLTRPVAERVLQSGFGRHLDGVDRDEITALGRQLLEEKPRTRGELIPSLRDRWPDVDAQALGYAATIPLPLVQLPPRGLWGQTGRAILTTAEAWLGEPLATDPSPDDLVLRYLAAFGPASNADVRTWSGLTGVNEVTRRLRPRLRVFTDDNGRELFDVLDGPLPDPDTPAPPRFLPEFDNVFLSHQHRSRIIAGEVPVASITVARTVRKLLIDGYVNAEWSLTSDRGASTLTIQPYRPLSKGEVTEVTAEAARLLDFAAPDDVHDVVFASPAPPDR